MRRPPVWLAVFAALALGAAAMVGAVVIAAGDAAQRPPAEPIPTKLTLPSGTNIADLRKVDVVKVVDGDTIDVKIDVIEPTGPDTLVFAQVNGKRVVSRVHPASNPQPLTNMTLLFDVSKAVLFDSKTEERLA